MFTVHHKTIAGKFKFVFTIIALCFIVVLMGLTGYLTNSNKRNLQFYNERCQQIQALDDILTGNQGAAKSCANMVLLAGGAKTGATAAIDAQFKEATAFYQQVSKGMDSLKTAGLFEESTLAALEGNLPVYKSTLERIYDLAREGRSADAQALYQGSFTDVQGLFAGKASQQLTVSRADLAKQMQAGKGNLQLVYLLILLVVVAGCAALTYVYKRFVKIVIVPINALHKAATDISAGRISFDFGYQNDNEIGQLIDAVKQYFSMMHGYLQELTKSTQALSAGDLTYTSHAIFSGDFAAIHDSLKHISKYLNQLVAQIDVSAEQVLVGAEQIAASGQSLSQSSVEQASSVTELAATINDVSERIQHTASGALEASRRGEQVSRDVDLGSKRLNDVNGYMQTMRSVSGQTAGIVKDIENIAFQTNLLALNAAVEAARAGDAGRGFAVVAKEIRNLANKSTEASKSTSELINKTVKMIMDSSAMSQEAVTTLEKIDEEVKSMAEMIDDISRSLNEQATAVVQIRQSIDMISEAVQENSATAEESAASSEELTGQMQMLKKLVESFKYASKEADHE